MERTSHKHCSELYSLKHSISAWQGRTALHTIAQDCKKDTIQLFRLPGYCTVIPFPGVPSLLLTCTVLALSAQGSLHHSEFRNKGLRACTQSSYHRVTSKTQVPILVYLSVKYFDHPCTSTNQPPYYCTANLQIDGFKKNQTS